MKFVALSALILFSSLSFASTCPDPEDFNCHTPKNCQDPWGNTLEHGKFIYAYAKGYVSSTEDCEGERRICNNGQLTGSYISEFCRVNSTHQSPDESN